LGSVGLLFKELFLETSSHAQDQQELSEQIPMTDGFSISCRHWPSRGVTNRTIIGIPGTSGNAEFFRPIGIELAAQGNEVYAADLRGFGNSVEKGLERGDTHNFKRHLKDLDEIVQHIRLNHTGKLFMFGHSHGCAYTLWYAANHPDKLDGIILAAPPVTVSAGSKVPRSQYLMFALLLVFRPKTMYSFGKPDGPEELISNPLMAQRLSIRWLYGSKTNLVGPLLQNAARIQRPVLIVQGGEDTVALSEGAKTLFDTLGSNEKSIETFPSTDHFLYGALFPSLNYGDPIKKREVSGIVGRWLAKY
jgi:alpha-beta hydrolase superfamily lysophospholipase